MLNGNYFKSSFVRVYFSRLVVERISVMMKLVPPHNETTFKSLSKRKFGLEKIKSTKNHSKTI